MPSKWELGTNLLDDIGQTRPLLGFVDKLTRKTYKTDEHLILSMINEFDQLDDSHQNNCENWVSGVLSKIPDDSPPNLKRALRYLCQCVINEKGFWTKLEREAIEKLFTTRDMVEVHTHIDKFIGYDDWPPLIIDVLIAPYAKASQYSSLREEAKITALDYADIALKAYQLRESLDCLHFRQAGYNPEVEELVNSTALNETLLALISLTTECKWINDELAQLKGIGWSEDVADTMNAESVSVYRRTTNKKLTSSHSERRLGYTYIGEVFRPNQLYEQSKSKGLNYDHSLDPSREIFLKKNDGMPPMFPPRTIKEEFSDEKFSRSCHITYLKQAIYRLDQFSTQDGRPQRIWRGGPQNKIGRNSPIWLAPKHCTALVKALYQMELDERQARALLKKNNSPQA